MAELHQFLETINESEYLKYQENIKQYLGSNAAKKFDTSYYVQTIVNRISQDLNI